MKIILKLFQLVKHLLVYPFSLHKGRWYPLCQLLSGSALLLLQIQGYSKVKKKRKLINDYL